MIGDLIRVYPWTRSLGWCIAGQESWTDWPWWRGQNPGSLDTFPAAKASKSPKMSNLMDKIHQKIPPMWSQQTGTVPERGGWRWTRPYNWDGARNPPWRFHPRAARRSAKIRRNMCWQWWRRRRVWQVRQSPKCPPVPASSTTTRIALRRI